MYNSYFNFSRSPFENNLDQRFLFLSDDHQEVLAALLHFIKTQQGFAVVCGDVGTGKTMLIYALLDRLPETVTPLLISHPYVNTQDILFSLAKTLKIKTTGVINVLALIDEIKVALTEAKNQNKCVLLIIDEAHLLSYQALEEIRLLSNIEKTDQKLIHILLVGQYGLCHKLDRAEMRHLRQRLNVNRFLSYLGFTETIQYIDYRLQQAGSSLASVFEDNCKRPIFKMTQGIPRLINQLCDNAFLISMAQGLRKVNRKILRQAQKALQTDRIFTLQPSLRKEKSQLGKYAKILGLMVASFSIALICILSVIMAGKYLPVSHIIKSVGQSLPQIKSRSAPVEINQKPAPSTKEDLITLQDPKLSKSTLAKGPPQDLKQETPAIIPPALEVKIASAPIQGGTHSIPEVKPEAPSPHESAGAQQETIKKEVLATGTTPESREKVDSQEPKSPTGQIKPEGETLEQASLPTPPAFKKLVTKEGDTLTRIASKHYPEDPQFGIFAIILQNPNVTDKNKIKSKDVLYLPKINSEKRTIQLKDNLWYAPYDGYNSQESTKKIASWLTIKEVKSLVKQIRSGAGNTTQLIFIGDYATEAELVKALDSLTTKD